MAIGSRYVTGGGIDNWPLDRIFIKRWIAVYTNDYIDAGKRSTAGFVCYKREVLETINLNKIKFIGYAFQIEMKYAAWKLGFKIKEVPIIFKDRDTVNPK